MTLWDWLDNPSGIFHGPKGTNWNFVLETAVSWLIPTFVAAALIAVVCHLFVSGIRHFATNRRIDARRPSSDA